MKFFNKQNNNLSKGFTLIETMIAVLILSTSLASLLTLSTNSLFAAKYANNEIIANYLLQEAVDYLRNERDSLVFRQAATAGASAFISDYYTPCSSSSDGCYIDVGSNILNGVHSATSCNLGAPGNGFTIKCPGLYYKADAAGNNFYSHSGSGTTSNFKRKIVMSRNSINGQDELDITVTVEWKNGNLIRTRSLQSSLLNWQIN